MAQSDGISKAIRACACQGQNTAYVYIIMPHVNSVPAYLENTLAQRKLAINKLVQQWKVAKISDKSLALESLAKLCEAGEIDLRMVALQALTVICRRDAYMREQVRPNRYVFIYRYVYIYAKSPCSPHHTVHAGTEGKRCVALRCQRKSNKVYQRD